MRRSGDPGFGAITRLQQFNERLRRAQALSHLNERADDVAYHMAEESRCFDRVNQQIASLVQRIQVNFSNWMRRVATRSAEGGKIMLADQTGNRLSHRVHIQRLVQVPSSVQIEWRRRRSIEDMVLVYSTAPVAARV